MPNQSMPLNFKITTGADGKPRFFMDGRQVSEHEFYSTIWTGSRYVDQPSADGWSKDVPD
jgi:hypothetical protein